MSFQGFKSMLEVFKGLENAPALFQHLINQAMCCLKGYSILVT